MLYGIHFCSTLVTNGRLELGPCSEVQRQDTVTPTGTRSSKFPFVNQQLHPWAAAGIYKFMYRSFNVYGICT
jgi:hypothetical protein